MPKKDQLLWVVPKLPEVQGPEYNRYMNVVETNKAVHDGWDMTYGNPSTFRLWCYTTKANMPFLIADMALAGFTKLSTLTG